MRHAQVGFRTDCHRVFTTRTTKTSLSAFDSKRFLLEDGIHSLAYGHYLTRPPLPAPLADADVEELLAGLV